LAPIQIRQKSLQERQENKSPLLRPVDYLLGHAPLVRGLAVGQSNQILFLKAETFATQTIKTPAEWHEDLSLVAASGELPVNLFTRMADTSAATALASKMCAEIQTANPSLWPETVRGILVHSAEWTPAMRQEIFGQLSKKQRVRRHIRKYGHGVPSLDRALYSMKNDLTMVIEDEIFAF
jgi:hypothetical protein